VCASWFSPVVMVVHLLVSSLAAKGKRSNGEGRKERGGDKSFCGTQKVLAECISPLDDDPTVLQAALRVRTHGGWPHRVNRMHAPDTSERRGGLKATAPPARSGRPASGRCKPGVDLSHQTLASARNRLRVRRSPAGASAADLAEWGSTTGPPRGPGAGGHRPALFSGYSHGAADAKVNRQDAGYDARDKEHRAHQAEARYEQVAHRVSNSTKSGRTGRGRIRQREQRGSAEGASPSPFPAGNSPSRRFRRAVASGRKKGLPANRQPLHKGASGMSTQSQPLNGGVSPPGLAT
jgi:hypothetical protein